MVCKDLNEKNETRVAKYVKKIKMKKKSLILEESD